MPSTALLAQGQNDIEFLRARAEAHERKISQLEAEVARLKTFHHAQKREVGFAQTQTGSKTSSGKVYTVVKGDVLSRIASRYGTSVSALKKANALRSDRIQIGQKLRIPGASGSNTSLVSTAREAKKAPVAKSATGSKHVVKQGETFYSIARLHKMSTQDLMDANPSVRPTRLRIGQHLNVQVAKASTVATKQKAPVRQSSKVAKAPQSKAPKSKKSSREMARSSATASQSKKKAVSEPALRTITVSKKMTYGQFANKYGASTTQLNELNGLSLSKSTMLAKGSELYVPKY